MLPSCPFPFFLLSLFPIHLCPFPPPFFSTTKHLSSTLLLLLLLLTPLWPLDDCPYTKQSHLLVKMDLKLHRSPKGHMQDCKRKCRLTWIQLLTRVSLLTPVSSFQLCVVYLLSKSARPIVRPFSPQYAAASFCFPVLRSPVQHENSFHMFSTEECNEENGRVKKAKEAQRKTSQWEDLESISVPWLLFYRLFPVLFLW